MYLPPLAGKVDPDVERAIIVLYQIVYRLLNLFRRFVKQKPPLPDMAYIRRQLQASGDYPLNVTNLLGTGGGSSPVSVAGQYANYQLLTADVVISSPATPADGNTFALILEENSSGFHQVAFSTDFKLVIPGDVDTRPGRFTTLFFVGQGGYWWLTPSRGRT